MSSGGEVSSHWASVTPVCSGVVTLRPGPSHAGAVAGEVLPLDDGPVDGPLDDPDDAPDDGLGGGRRSRGTAAGQHGDRNEDGDGHERPRWRRLPA